MIAANRTAPSAHPRSTARCDAIARRWKIERLFAWLHNSRRLVTRWEYHADELSRHAATRLRPNPAQAFMRYLLVESIRTPMRNLHQLRAAVNPWQPPRPSRGSTVNRCQLWRSQVGGKFLILWCRRRESCPKAEARSADGRVPDLLWSDFANRSRCSRLRLTTSASLPGLPTEAASEASD